MKSKQELIEEWESAIEAAEFHGKGKEERLISYMKDFVSDLNQLDEPEVLSQEWIEEHAFDSDDYFSARDMMDSSVRAVAVENLQNLLVPKQEVTEEQKYYVVDNAGRNLLYKHDGNVITELEATEFTAETTVTGQLTEQEIKDYDPRYMIFAKPVEEVD